MLRLKIRDRDTDTRGDGHVWTQGEDGRPHARVNSSAPEAGREVLHQEPKV